MTNNFTLDELEGRKASNPGVEVRGVLLPIQETNLLLPNISVVEVIGFREEDQVENAPGWLRGTVNWNQRRIPVVSFEFFLHEEAAEPGYRARIAVCHNLQGDARLPFIGVLCSSIPRLARVNDDTVHEFSMFEMRPEMTLRHVTCNGEDAWLPDIEKLGQACVDALYPG